ncbi:hypothetical protein TEU_08610 [Thermococcus eurythermalis]|uniref:Uncharacterized protein n=1 Tax=Thermococcus eurythermalis TaxID=1505907 RepID=A0A097QV92_9EURY|nr:hypothetical protein [Thermococcus eurythermalis]AIU70387.1 hypothetical protein TEU_08610 [Thermococcus eurythermalis]
MRRFKCIIPREWFLLALIGLYLVLTVFDPGLPRRTPQLIDWKSISAITGLLTSFPARARVRLNSSPLMGRFAGS